MLSGGHFYLWPKFVVLLHKLQSFRIESNHFKLQEQAHDILSIRQVQYFFCLLVHAHLFQTMNHFAARSPFLVPVRLHKEPHSVAKIEVNLAGKQNQVQQLIVLKVTKIPLQKEWANLGNEELQIVSEWTAEVRIDTALGFEL